MIYIRGIRKHTGAVVAFLILLSSCSVSPPTPKESASMPYVSELSSIPELRVEEFTEEETPSDMGSYITACTDPPVHFDVETIRVETEEAARAVAGIYRTMDYHDGFELTYLPTKAELHSIVRIIGEMGYPIITDDMDMVNTDIVLRFWQQAEDGESAFLAVFVLEGYGNLYRVCFSAASGKVYTTSISIVFDTDGNTEVSQITYEKLLDYFFLTDKGFLIYGNEGTGWAGLAQGFRVSPLGQDKRRLNRTYIQPLGGFNGHNILVENWDRGNMDTLSFNDAFEMLYEYEYGISPDTLYKKQYSPSVAYIKAIPGPEFEAIMSKYFNVGSSKLREWAVYDAEQDMYAWEMYISNQYQPSWEVVDYTENTDGTITLVVDTYSIRHYTDHIATSYVTVMPREDGSFYYVSNRVESSGDMKWFPDYGPRIRK